MNKKLILCLIPFILLTGCNKNKEEEQPGTFSFKVACPVGAPATAFYAHFSDPDLEVGNADTVVAYLSNNSDKDAVVVPTNAGIAAINKGANYKLAATITFGNFFLLSTGNDADQTLNEGDKVLAFQQNGVPGKLFNYVYGDKQLDVTFLADAPAVKNEVLTGSNTYDYIYLAQPVVTAVMSQKQNLTMYANVQQDYKAKTNGLEITQASIFIKNDANHDNAKLFLEDLDNDVTRLLADPENVLTTATSSLEAEVVTGKLNGTVALVSKLLKNGNSLGLGFKYAKSNKAAIDAFIGTLGMPASSDSIYFE